MKRKQKSLTETPEEKEKWLIARCEYEKRRRVNESEESREKRLAQQRLNREKKHANESSESRKKRLATQSQYQRQKIANESAECRDKRLLNQRQYQNETRRIIAFARALLEINFVFSACICLSFYAIIGLSCNCFCVVYTNCKPRYVMIQDTYSLLDLSRWTERLSRGLLSSKIGSSLCLAKLPKLQSFRKRPIKFWLNCRIPCHLHYMSLNTNRINHF